jgi:hypothetical protein
MFRAIFCPSSGAYDCGLQQYGVLFNVEVGRRSGVHRHILCVRCEGYCSSDIHHTECIVHAATPQTSNLLQHWTIHHTAVTTVLRSWRWAKDCPKHVELIQRSIKLLLLRLSGHLYYSPILMMHSQTQIKGTSWFILPIIKYYWGDWSQKIQWVKHVTT